VKKSLGTDSFALAVRLCHQVASEIESMFEEKRYQAGMPFEDRLIFKKIDHATVPATITQRASPACAGSSDLTLTEVYQRYIEDPTKRRSDRTMLAHDATRRVVECALGATTPLGSLTREHCRELLELLRYLPVNFGKKYPKLTVREVVDLAKKDERIRTINPTNLNAYMARFATMMNWAVAEEYIGRNPARGLQIAETVHSQDRRKPFELWQLQRIFSAPIYTGCRDEQNGYSVAGAVIASGARYWVPIIALWSGMRLNEACQLDVADVRELEGVQCMVITEESLSGSRDKSLKTRSSERIVPIHPALLDVGFLKFVAARRDAGATKLFDDLPVGARGFRSVAMSRWFSRFLVSANAASDRTCFHSFRHGFRDAARNARIDRDIALRLGGWITGGSHSESADDYGDGYRPRVLFEAISAIEFEGLDLSHLMDQGIRPVA
jgi:integrase